MFIVNLREESPSIENQEIYIDYYQTTDEILKYPFIANLSLLRNDAGMFVILQLFKSI